MCVVVCVTFVIESMIKVSTARNDTRATHRGEYDSNDTVGSVGEDLYNLYNDFKILEQFYVND